MGWKKQSIGSLLLISAVSGCMGEVGDEADQVGAEVSDPVTAGLLDASWPGYELGVKAPRFVDLGAVEIGDADEPRANPIAKPSDGSFVHLPETELEMVDFERGRRYRVSLPEGIERVAAAQIARIAALTTPDPLDQAVESELTDKRVLGVDTRIRMGLEDGISKTAWQAGIGSISAGCTGTVIDNDTILLAAHCIYNYQGKLLTSSFTPRIDNSTYTVDNPTDPVAPYGVWKGVKAVAPAAFTNNKCHIQASYTRDCNKYDVAILKVTRPAVAASHNRIFNVAAETAAALSTRQLRTMGYPLCSGIDAPVGCVDDTLYGDKNLCKLGAAFDTEAYSAAVQHTCDTSGGQSGAPMFYYTATTPVVIGVHTGGDPTNVKNFNIMRRFSPNTLTWLRGLM